MRSSWLMLVLVLAGLPATPAVGDAPRASEAADRVDDPPSRPRHLVVRHQTIRALPTLGPRHAPVTVDFFLNLREGRSLALHKFLVELAERHPRRLRVVYRFDLDSGRTKEAEAAMEAFAQGKFWEFMDSVSNRRGHRMASQSRRFAELCREAGLDYERVESAWELERHMPVLAANDVYLNQRQVPDVPAVLFNGRPPEGVGTRGLNLDRLESAYDEAYAAATKMMDDGARVEDVYPLSLREIDVARKPEPLRLRRVDGVTVADGQAPLDNTPLVRHQEAPEGYVLGPIDAPVTIGLYCHFRSEKCAAQVHDIDRVAASFPDRVRLVVHPMIGPEAEEEMQRDILLVHRAARCAHRQGAFRQFYTEAYDLLGQPQYRTRGLSAEDHVAKVSDRLELNRKRYQACMDQPGGDEAVMAEVRAARKAGVVRTPTLVIGGRIYPGSRTRSELQSLVEQELLPGLLEQFVPTWGTAP